MASYNTYDFDPDTPFIPLKCGCGESCSVDTGSIKTTVENAVNNSIGDLDKKLNHIHCQINCATSNIINEIKEGNQEICLCNVANKNDIKSAINEINNHIDDKFNEVDFIKQFDNLNNQLKEIKNNG